MKTSNFKTVSARQALEKWIDYFVEKSSLPYAKLDVATSYGTTRLLAVNHENQNLKPILFLPGARTCGIFWDLNNHLHLLGYNYRIYLLDVIGQPSLSSGNCPDIKGDGYGVWLKEVCDEIGFKKGICVGASFGGELIFKLAAIEPSLIEKAVLMNPIGLSFISLSPRTLYYTLLPIYSPARKNIRKFFEKIVFTPEEKLDDEKFEMLIDYTENVLKNFDSQAQNPIKLSDAEIKKLQAETYLIVGAKDGLIPQHKTVERARKILPNLKDVTVFPNIAHGIETQTAAILKLREVL